MAEPEKPREPKNPDRLRAALDEMWNEMIYASPNPPVSDREALRRTNRALVDLIRSGAEKPEVMDEDIRIACDYLEDTGYGSVADRLRVIVRAHVEVEQLKGRLRQAQEYVAALEDMVRRRDEFIWECLGFTLAEREPPPSPFGFAHGIHST
jgi:hypothetical protein